MVGRKVILTTMTLSEAILYYINTLCLWHIGIVNNHLPPVSIIAAHGDGKQAIY